MSVAELNQDHLQQIAASVPWLAKRCIELLREDRNVLDAYLTHVGSKVTVDGTNASARCHLVGLDANGRPRIDDLAVLLANSVIQYCIPRSEIQKATKSLVEKGNAREMKALGVKAEGLFTELSNSGEGGELLLYMLAESVLGIPQVLCKMALKSSPHVHYHGVDGIHATVDEATGMLTLYWCEAKLHGDVNDAVRECFESISPFLLEQGGDAAHKRDLHLLRDNLDLGNPKLEEAFQRYLDPDHLLHKKLQFRAACLVGFDSTVYPATPNTKIEDDVRKELVEGLDALWKRVGKNVVKQKIDTFKIEVFCLPFPSVESFRLSFRKELKLD